MSDVASSRPSLLTSLRIGMGQRDMMFAAAIVLILMVLFMPIPSWLLDGGLAISLALSVLILMVALWINKPLDFSSFPTILLVATTLRLALNIATTRLILSDGHTGHDAAGHVIEGFANFVMNGNFLIGLIVFAILTTVNFMVITKGATRVAEVTARFTLDAIPGKQMAIDADLSAGLIDDEGAQRRRRELEDESSFFGSMDGASKFVRGDAIASLIITFINVIGGILIGVGQQDLAIGEAVEIYTILSVGDGLVSQIPGLIVSLAAGLLVTKGGNVGSADKAVLRQLGGYPKALAVASLLMGVLALTPGLPVAPFLLLSSGFGVVAWYLPKHFARLEFEQQRAALAEAAPQATDETPIEEMLRIDDIQVEVGNQLVPLIISEGAGLTAKVKLLRKRFAKEYGFFLPKIRIKDNAYLPPKGYEIAVQGVVVGKGEIWPNYMLAIDSAGKTPRIQGEETREPTFGLPARWISKAFAEEAEAKGYTVVDAESVVITHLTEAIKDNLTSLLSYASVRKLLDGLDGDYQKLVHDLVPSQITMAALQNVLQGLLAEHVSIRNLPRILEGVSEAVAHTRNVNVIVEHVRTKLAQQICQNLIGPDGFISVVTLAPKWEQAFLDHIKPEGEDRVFTMPPTMVHEFVLAARPAIQEQIAGGNPFAILASQDARPFIRSILERVSPSTPVISHAELHRKTPIKTVAQI
ncbi:flagellar biosynthesis protein FlhA [Rhodospirillaceae bacterium SYSU D60014]|uniref:flagellar biosynthesis protein FlhA n=1 Tax=Virgifigura deserti TaxID=2268457 RepID=UPI000E6606CF